MKEIKHFHLYAGLGGYAKGLQQAVAEYGGRVGTMRLLGGVDVDPEACADFETITGVRATQLDLFTRADYMAFHGHEPPAVWREATAEDLRAAAGYEYPDVLAMSPPCKGFSGLLPGEKAASPQYQALNRLVPRGLDLSMEAWGDDPPAVILLENVPGIVKRGAGLLAQVRALLGRHGYVFDPPAGRETDGYHDCGELGGLGQRRKRFLLIARLPGKCPAFVYEPPKQRVKSIGEILGPLPLPGDPVMGPMHRIPHLQWKTWVRLALIPAGGDWRDLQNIRPGEYGLKYVPRGGGPFGVQEWDEPGATVTGHPGPRGSNAASVADPRLEHEPREGVYRVQKFDEPSTTVTGQARVNTSNGAAAVADPRLPERDSRHPATYQVVRFEEPAPCVTGTRFGSGAPAVADPRVGGGYAGKRQVLDWDGPSTCVTGTPDIQSGAQSVADPRVGLGKGAHHNILRMTPWNKQAGTVTGADRPAAGALSVADPRLSDGVGEKFAGSPGLYGVLDWEDPAQAVTGGAKVSSSNCPSAVADPRLNPRDNRRSNSHSVRGWEDPAFTVTGEDTIGSGAPSVADPREWFHHSYGVRPWAEPAATVTSGHSPSSGANTVADPRLGCTPRNGLYGVQDWDKPGNTVTGARKVDSGTVAVADPRVPRDSESGVWVIVALDGTWHRPLTTLELAALQGFDVVMPDGRPLVLAGKNDARWRERIGNAVPPPAAQAIGEKILLALLNERGDLMLSNEGIWVAPGTPTLPVAQEGMKDA